MAVSTGRLLSGRDGACSFNGAVIAHCRAWTLNIVKDLIDTTSLNVDDRTYIESLRGASGSIIVQYNDANPTISALFNRILLNDMPPGDFEFILNTFNNRQLTAAAFINNMASGSAVGEGTVGTLSVTVTGPTGGGF